MIRTLVAATFLAFVSKTGASTFSDADWLSMGQVPGVDGTVYATLNDSSGGNFYVGGSFGAAGDAIANNVARWDGQNWHALGSGVDSSVFALEMIGGELYAAGQFTSAGGVVAKRGREVER